MPPPRPPGRIFPGWRTFSCDAAIMGDFVKKKKSKLDGVFYVLIVPGKIIIRFLVGIK